MKNNFLKNPHLWLWLFLLPLLSNCSQPRILKEVFKKQTPHEAYLQKLEKAGLLNTNMGQQWVQISRQSLDQAIPIKIPFSETGYFPSDKPVAVAYQFDAKQGEKLVVKLRYHNPSSFRLFGDLYKINPDAAPAHQASLDTTAIEMSYEVEATGAYVLRLQPELLQGGNYQLSLIKVPTLAFPVQGHGNKSIGSFFGDPRDGGTRTHHGVDIFAKKGTPVLSASDGVVTRTGTNNLGGKVVWIFDSKKGHNFYYAHLDSQLVNPGNRVSKGEPIGLVGNTGNAKHTPPHLHFGLYSRGPTDPFPYLFQPDTTLPRITARQTQLSHSVRIKPAPQPKSKARKPVAAPETGHTIGEVVGAQGDKYRVLWPDGRHEYVLASATEPVSKPIRNQNLTKASGLLEKPMAEAVIIDSLSARQQVQVIGTFASYWFVQAGEKSGWVPVEALL